MLEKSVQLEQLMPLITERLAAGESVRFTPHGISMRPMLEGGRDNVVLSPITGKLKKYDLLLYRRHNGQYVLHRIVRVGETYTCRGDNQLYNESGIRPEQLIAVVTEFCRKGKTYPVTNPAYHLYCRILCWTRIPRLVLYKMARIIWPKEQSL